MNWENLEKVVERGDNRKWLKTNPKPNLLTITRAATLHMTAVDANFENLYFTAG